MNRSPSREKAAQAKTYTANLALLCENAITQLLSLAQLPKLHAHQSELVLNKLKLIGTNATYGAGVVLRKLGSIHLNLIATNGAYELVCLFCHVISSLHDQLCTGRLHTSDFTDTQSRWVNYDCV